MGNFVKRNLAWIAIFLCVIGVILSIVGIPTKQPLFFFIGIIFALPTIGYLVYQVFFFKGKPDLKVQTKAKVNKNLAGNITTILDKREDLLMANDETADLEPLYDGYATSQEIENQLSDIIKQEREKAIQATPASVITEEPAEMVDEDAIRATTQGELLRQRQIELEDIMDDVPEVEPAAEIIEEAVSEPEPEIIPEPIAEEVVAEPVAEPEPEPTVTPEEVVTEEPTAQEFLIEEEGEPEPHTEELLIEEVTEPEPRAEELLVEQAAQTEPVTETTPAEEPIPEPIQELQAAPEATAEVEPEPAPQPLPENQPKSNKIIITKEIDPEELAQRNELRRKKTAEKKALLAQENLEKYLQHYFLEIAACFMLDRNIYKDNRGLAPYNKLSINKNDGLPEYNMSATKGRLYKFCTYLIDMERFITHPALYEDFITAIEKGIPLGRVSETMHALYRKKYKKDFVLNLANREDWDNIIILVFNNYILDNDNFKDVFTRVPFEIPEAYNEQNITDYLSDPDIQERFLEKFPSFTEIGIPTLWEALYICFVNSIKTKLSTEQLETAILKEHKKIARALKRADKERQKLLKKAS